MIANKPEEEMLSEVLIRVQRCKSEAECASIRNKPEAEKAAREELVRLEEELKNLIEEAPNDAPNTADKRPFLHRIRHMIGLDHDGNDSARDAHQNAAHDLEGGE